MVPFSWENNQNLNLQEPQKSVDTMETQPMDSQPQDMSPVQPMQSLTPHLSRASTEIDDDDDGVNQEGGEEEAKTHDEVLVDICPGHLDDVISVASDEDSVMSPQKARTAPKESEEKQDSKDSAKQGFVRDLPDSAPAAPVGTLPTDPPKDESFPLEEHLKSDEEKEKQKGTFKVGTRGDLYQDVQM